jgi:hypothetical protein
VAAPIRCLSFPARPTARSGARRHLRLDGALDDDVAAPNAFGKNVLAVGATVFLKIAAGAAVFHDQSAAPIALELEARPKDLAALDGLQAVATSIQTVAAVVPAWNSFVAIASTFGYHGLKAITGT